MPRSRDCLRCGTGLPHSQYFLGPALPVFRSRIGVHQYPPCWGENRITTREWTRCYASVRKHVFECFKVSLSSPHDSGSAAHLQSLCRPLCFKAGAPVPFPICILALLVLFGDTTKGADYGVHVQTHVWTTGFHQRPRQVAGAARNAGCIPFPETMLRL